MVCAYVRAFLCVLVRGCTRASISVYVCVLPGLCACVYICACACVRVFVYLFSVDNHLLSTAVSPRPITKTRRRRNQSKESLRTAAHQLDGF